MALQNSIIYEIHKKTIKSNYSRAAETIEANGNIVQQCFVTESNEFKSRWR